MKLTSMEDLLVYELQDLLSGEMQMVEALPLMQKAASHPELKAAFEKHLQETKQQVKRLEIALSYLDAEVSHTTVCKAMKGMIAEGEEIIKIHAPDDLKDAGLIGAAQKIEHYEIAGYGTAKAHAAWLSLDEVVNLLDETLQEEASTDKKLTKLAEGSMFTSGINKQASK
ncbi:Protein YciF [Neochlamydia sp. TUME1]|uniref:YciE/YciF ferroxidase family protein n=1 Tax=Neochlamydia sp. TUME1 TaxID=1478174 RepID=UPI00057F211D|nr:ferritin-like domain-containing protein [Neochlamydia sp. TUME1]KIC75106.1 Protein YciF [Neochlamydia sp. TUME1]